MKRSTICIGLFVLIVALCLSASALAEAEVGAKAVSKGQYGQYVSGDYEYDLDGDGNAIIRWYGGNDTSVSFPSSLDGHSVVEIRGSKRISVIKDRWIVESITIPNSVTTLGESAFCYCYTLSCIDIPESVTAIKDNAFLECNSLREIRIPDGVTNIGSSAFSGCHSITNIAIPNGVTVIENDVFCGCRSLNSVTIPDGVSLIKGWAFVGCTNLDGIVIPDSVERIEDCAFGGCESLVSITIPDSVKSIGVNIFSECLNLESIILSSKITIIPDGAFSYCKSLSLINIPESIIHIGSYAFSQCHNLENISVPSGLRMIGDGAFKNCSSLTDFDIPDSVGAIAREVFSGCSSLRSIVLPDSVTRIESEAFKHCSSLISVTIPPSVTTIASDAFSYHAPTLIIYGAFNSYAETYALKHEIEFVDMSIPKLEIAQIADQPYTGKAIKPTLNVTSEGKTLTVGIDYTVTYSNNVEIGIANVTVKGVGKYKGAIAAATFEIVEALPSEPVVLDIRALAVKKGGNLTPPEIIGYQGTWSVDDESIASVLMKKKSVKVQGLTLGETKLMFTVTDVLANPALLGDRVLDVGDVYEIPLCVREKKELAKKVNSGVKKNKLNMMLGETYLLNAKAMPAAKVRDGELFYISGNPAVATVGKNGLIVARSTGKAGIFIYSSNLKKVKVVVTVK